MNGAVRVWSAFMHAEQQNRFQHCECSIIPNTEDSRSLSHAITVLAKQQDTQHMTEVLIKPHPPCPMSGKFSFSECHSGLYSWALQPAPWPAPGTFLPEHGVINNPAESQKRISKPAVIGVSIWLFFQSEAVSGAAESRRDGESTSRWIHDEHLQGVLRGSCSLCAHTAEDEPSHKEADASASWGKGKMQQQSAFRRAQLLPVLMYQMFSTSYTPAGVTKWVCQNPTHKLRWFDCISDALNVSDWILHGSTVHSEELLMYSGERSAQFPGQFSICFFWLCHQASSKIFMLRHCTHLYMY